MKVILTEDLGNIGHKGEVVEVKPGFGRNYLLRQDKAYLATDPRARALMNENKQHKDTKKASKDLVGQKITELEGQKFVFKVKTNSQGEPYKTINSKEIARVAGVEEKFVKMSPVKKIGEFKVKIVSPQAEAQITIAVEKEE